MRDCLWYRQKMGWKVPSRERGSPSAVLEVSGGRCRISVTEGILKCPFLSRTPLPAAGLCSSDPALRVAFPSSFWRSGGGECKGSSVGKSMYFLGITEKWCSKKCLTDLPEVEHFAETIAFKKNRRVYFVLIPTCNFQILRNSSSR